LKRGAAQSDSSGFWPVNADSLAGLVDKPWSRVFAAVNPYSDTWRSDLLAIATQTAAANWKRICAAFPAATPSHIISRQVWAALNRDDPDRQVGLALTLELAAKSEDRVPEVLDALRATIGGGAARSSHWARVILGQEQPRPAHLIENGINPYHVLRYQLAVASRKPSIKAVDLLSATERYRSISRRNQGRLLSEALQHGKVLPLTPAATSRLSMRTRLLLIECPSVRNALADKNSAELETCLISTRNQWRSQRAVRRRYKSFLTHLYHRELEAAEKLAAALITEPSLSDATADLYQETEDAMLANGAEYKLMLGAWYSAYSALVTLLTRVAPSSSTAQLFSMPAAEIAAQASRNRKLKVVESLNQRDVSQLQSLWAPTQCSALLQAGRLDLLPARYAAHNEEDVARAISLLPHPRANALVLGAFTADHTYVILNAASANRRLTSLIRAAVERDSALLPLLIPRLGHAALERILTPKRLSTKPHMDRALAYWHTQSEGKRTATVLNRLAHAIGKLPAALRSGPVASYLDLAPSAARRLLDILGEGPLAKILPSLGRSHWCHASRADATLIVEAIKSGVLHGDTATVLAGIEANPNLIRVLRRNPPIDLPNQPSIADVTVSLLRDCSADLISRLRGNVGDARFKVAADKALALLPRNTPRAAFLDVALAAPGLDLRLLARAFDEARFRAARGSKFDHCYTTYQLPKKAGGKRTITIPSFWLRKLQKDLHRLLLLPIPPHSSVHGFVSKRSVLTNAAPHVNQPVVVNCDISNCFPSVKRSLIVAAIRRDFSDRLSANSIRWLADVCCYKGALAVGAPTSPALLNRVLLNTDIYVASHARKRGVAYTRYADDLTFSGGDSAVGMLRIVASSLSRIGLELDPRKTNIYRRGRRQLVTGLVVNDKPSVPRRLRRRARAAVHAIENNRTPTWHGRPVTETSLRGWLAYSRHVNREEVLRLLDRLNKITK